MNNDIQALPDIFPTLNSIIQQASEQAYLFRGEPKHYCKVSSGLYREFKHIRNEEFHLDYVQAEILEEATKFAPELSNHSPSNIFARLQHYGFKTNFIDFTSDFLVALFFACDGETEPDGQDLKQQDGRMILLSRRRTNRCTTDKWDKRWEAGEFIHTLLEDDKQDSKSTSSKPNALEMPEAGTRFQTQKSVLIHTPIGYVEPDCSINIPYNLKDALLSYLDKCHNVKASTIYNDLHGFIRYRSSHRSAVAELFSALEALLNDKPDATLKHIQTARKLMQENNTFGGNLLQRIGAKLDKWEKQLQIQDN